MRLGNSVPDTQSILRSIICQLVTYERSKTKENVKLLAITVVTVAYERWSLTRGSKYSDLSCKLLVFWKTGHRGEVVTYERWYQLENQLYFSYTLRVQKSIRVLVMTIYTNNITDNIYWPLLMWELQLFCRAFFWGLLEWSDTVSDSSSVWWGVTLGDTRGVAGLDGTKPGLGTADGCNAGPMVGEYNAATWQTFPFISCAKI